MKACLLALIVSSGLVCGCRSSAPPGSRASAPIAPPTRAETSIGLRESLEIWRRGERERAVHAYVDAAEAATSGVELCLFEMTEPAYNALPADERGVLLDRWIKDSSELRALTRAVFKRERESWEGGDATGSGRYLDAVERVGRAHAESDCVLIGRATGEAILMALEARRDERSP